MSIAETIAPRDTVPEGKSGFGDIVDLVDFFENGEVALHLVGSNGVILHANKAELDLLGYRAEDYVGRHIAAFHADADVIADMLARLGRGEKLHRYPARLRASDGSLRHVEVTSSGNFKNGAFVNTRCFTVDVSEKVRAREDAVRKERLHRDVLEALPTAIYTTDQNGAITYFNRAAAELAGREPEIGKDHWCVTYKLFTADGRALAHDECPMATALKENRPVRGVEAMAQRPDGTLFPFLPFPTPLRDADGQLIGAVNMLVDISERKQSETNQRVLLDELNHRVKNNLQMLHSLLSGAVRDAHSPDARAVLGDAAQRVAAMAAAQHLLYRDNNPRACSASEFLHAVCNSAQQAFPETVSLMIEATANTQVASEFSMPLALITNELLTNAAKYGAGLDGETHIKVSLHPEGQELVLIVHDSGPGFDVMPSTRRSSGLGLVQGLVRQLGGGFDVERATGAQCIVRFPNRQP